ncbi:MAG: MBL fold metallo-hydrolase [bacterium]|nr:MBL fold metallo-hydrolase [bacterium]
MEQVSRHVFADPILDGPSTVGAIQTPEGVILIDSPNQPSRAVRWREEAGALGEVRYLVNTDYHIDHTFGNAYLPGTVIAHQVTKDIFFQDTAVGPCPMKDPAPYIARIDPGGAHLAEGYVARPPEITFRDRLKIYLGGVEVEIFEAPGHISCMLVVYVPGDKTLFASDTVFNNVMSWYHDALPFAWLESLDRLRAMDIETVIPGHGAVGGPELLDEMKATVQGAIDQVQAVIGTGASREEAIGKIPFLGDIPVSAGFKPMVGKLQAMFVGNLYDQITAGKS